MDDTQTLTGDISPECSQSHSQRSNPPESSCVSMKSDQSIDPPLKFKGKHTSANLSQSHHQRSNPSKSSCVSMKSDQSIDPPLKFKGRHTSTGLRLIDCGVTDEGCAALASALRSNPSHLRELYLSMHKLGDSGVKLLSDLKDDQHYKLETLELIC